MDLTNEFDVPAPIDEAWRILTDIELIAPCMPGAQLTEVEGETFRGSVKVKVGPITAQFKGEASFLERDETAHRAVLKAQGRDTTGKGNANATITAQLEPAGDGTHVTITTDLAISGRVAQFGRGALVDVSTKLLGQFTDCLEHDVLGDAASDVAAASASLAEGSGSSAPSGETGETGGAEPDPEAAGGPAGATPAPGPGATGAPVGARRIDAPEAEAIDLLDAAGGSVAKRVAPILSGLLVLLWVLRRRRRR